MLKGQLSKTVSQELVCVAKRIWDCADNYPEERLPRKLADEFAMILDSLESMQETVCDSDSRELLPRHPKCNLTYLRRNTCDEQLRLSKENAASICTALYEEEIRINRLIDRVRDVLPDSELQHFIRLCARVMGNICAGVLGPLWHQHPELKQGDNRKDK